MNLNPSPTVLHHSKYHLGPVKLAIILTVVTWLLYAVFFASSGMYNIDELIYMAMINSFATTGSFVVENGYDLAPTDSLRLLLLIPGPHGLVPQYPSGYGILAAPFYLLGGLQGVIVLNTLASVFTMWLTYKIAQALFEDERLAINSALIFGLATFTVDYAFAIWPHAAANMCVAMGIYAAVLSVKSDTRPWLWAALAGLVIGLGVTIRMDVVIAAPILLTWVFINARRPFQATSIFVLTLTLGLCVAAWMNYLKFGVFSPLTYGREVGGTALASYAGYLPYALLAGILVLTLRWPRVQQLLVRKRAWVLLGLFVVVVVAIPPVRELALKILRGLYVLVVDIEQHEDISNPLWASMIGDHYLIYGKFKKPLVQSLPYLGLLVFAVAGIFRPGRRMAYALCVLFPIAWFLPFTPTQWFGGMANNMRYFSPALPLLAIVGAIGWREVAGRGVSRLPIYQFIAVMLSLSLMIGWLFYTKNFGFANAVFVDGGVNYLASVVLLLSLAWLFWASIQSRLRKPFIVVMQMAFFMAFIAGYFSDAYLTQQYRDFAHSHTFKLSYIEDNAHVLTVNVEPFPFQLTRADATLAIYWGEDLEGDINVINTALDNGRPVYLYSPITRQSVMRALAAHGHKIGPLGYTAKASLSKIDGQHYGLFKLERNDSYNPATKR